MRRTPPLVSLGETETACIRKLILDLGALYAAEELGISVLTMRKVASGEPVHRLTAATVRAKIGAL